MSATFDLTVIVLPTAWADDQLAITLDSVAQLMGSSGIRTECLIAEFLPAGTNVAHMRNQTVPKFPPAVGRYLEFEDFNYVVEYGSTARGLRRVVRCARGKHVCFLREGDQVGYSLTIDEPFADLDVAVAVPVVSADSFSVHRDLLAGPASTRAFPVLAAMITAYDGALVIRREFLDAVLGQQDFDAEPGYVCYLNEILALYLSARSGKAGLIRKLAVFPVAAHQEQHRSRICSYTLPTLRVRRKNKSTQLEAQSEALIHNVLNRLVDLFSPNGTAMAPPAALKDPQATSPTGELTAQLDVHLRWLHQQILKSWEWSPSGNLEYYVKESLAAPVTGETNPIVSLVSSAFRAERMMFGFLRNLWDQSIFDRAELLIVCPEPNLVQGLICEYFALGLPQVKVVNLSTDPGIYECWNIAIRQARGRYVSNANIDDRRDVRHLERVIDALESTGADVGSTAIAISNDLDEVIKFDGHLDALLHGQPHEVWYRRDLPPIEEKKLADFFVIDDRGRLVQCMNFPHCMPVWRRSLHDRFGYFDEAADGTYADFAYWLRAGSKGTRFVHLNATLGLYYVDPNSHNRRNQNEEIWSRIVREHLPASVDISAPNHVRTASVTDNEFWMPAEWKGLPKLNFGAQFGQNFGKHRSGWTYALSTLQEYHDPNAPIFCETFVEKKFVWGCDDGDASNKAPRPHRDPWVGFIHVPPNVPSWFQFEQSNQQVFSTTLWKQSLSSCRGLFCLTNYHRNWLLNELKPEFPISVLYHPTEFPDVRFDYARYSENPKKKLVQIGWWLRKLNAISRLRVSGHAQTLLGADDWSKNILTYAERRYFGLSEPQPADVIDFLDNDAYDVLLSENIVFIDFYDTSANNAVIECIARATPIVVCRHPAVEEYLGPEYPLYYKEYSEIPKLVADQGRVMAAALLLNDEEIAGRIKAESFVQQFATSDVVANLYGH